MDDFVRVYDAKTGVLTTIPARELAPGMLRARMLDIDGDVWIYPSQCKAGDYRHPPFSGEIRELLREIEETFREVHPLSLEAWEDGFRRDFHAEQEIAIWLHMASVFKQSTAGRDLDAAQRKDIYQVIVACATNGKDYVRFTTNPRTLSKKRVKEIVQAFFPEP